MERRKRRHNHKRKSMDYLDESTACWMTVFDKEKIMSAITYFSVGD